MSVASTPNYAPFHYRTNPDGAVDFICAECFLTIATGDSFDQLHKQDVAHSCLPLKPIPVKPRQERAFFLPQKVHCRFPVVALNSPHGTSGGFQSWSPRLYCLPGACRDLERLPHQGLPPQSDDCQRSPAGSADSLSRFWGQVWCVPAG
jgi:hypothetical protein